MLLLRHILVPTDFSPVSLAALREALRIASRCRSSVSLVHVVDAGLYGMAPDGIPAAINCAEREAELLMQQMRAEGVLNGTTPEFTITVGPVWPTISSIISARRSDLLVLGTHGRSGLLKFMLGSVAESAFREAPCAVMTMGPHVRRCGRSTAPPKHLLVPTDLSMAPTNALRYGLSLASATGGEMTLLHVCREKSDRDSEQSPSAKDLKNYIAEFVNECSGAAALVTPRVEFGAPAPTILAVAEQMHSDLIVMGLRAWSMDPTPMWRTAYEILTRARCPVLSMKSPAVTAMEP